MREDANENAIKDAFLPSQSKGNPNQERRTKEQKEKEKRNRARSGAVADPQPKDQSSKEAREREARVRGGEKSAKGTPVKPLPPNPKQAPTDGAKAPPAVKSKTPCLFFPKGTSNRGPSCPFAHVDPKPSAPGAAAKATVAATVAAILPHAAVGHASQRSIPSRSVRNVVKSVFGRILRWFIGWSTIATPAIIPGSQVGPYQVEWIADSGAGRNLTSAKALAQQGMYNFTPAQADPVEFVTGNGHFTSSEVVKTVGSCFGESSSYLMADCPVVRSMGELVNHHGRPFVWLPNSVPFFLPDSSSVISDQFGNIQMNTRMRSLLLVLTGMCLCSRKWSSLLCPVELLPLPSGTEPSVEPAEHPPGEPSVEPAEHPPGDVPRPLAAPDVTSMRMKNRPVAKLA